MAYKKDFKNEINTEIVNINKRLDELTSLVYKLVADIQMPQISKETQKEEIKKEKDVNVPQEYRDIVDRVLNRNFSLRITKEGVETLPGAFNFVIVCPEKYSTMTKAQKEILHEDVRPKVILPGEGINQIDLWVNTVFKSFNPTLQALIVSDR